MYHVSAQGVDERMINVHYYYDDDDGDGDDGVRIHATGVCSLSLLCA